MENKWLYENSEDNSARFILGQDGENPLICIGVNPSTATPEKLDPTLRLVKSRAEQLGHDGWVMLNLYPQRATNPNNLHVEADKELLALNMGYVADCLGICLKQRRPLTVWAAWGTLIQRRPYLKRGLKDLYSMLEKDNWITIGKRSVAGHPHHPLYLPKNSESEVFDVKQYMKHLK